MQTIASKHDQKRRKETNDIKTGGKSVRSGRIQITDEKMSKHDTKKGVKNFRKIGRGWIKKIIVRGKRKKNNN